MVAEARRHGWTFPYLYDETHDVARAFSAACTPRHVRLRQPAPYLCLPWSADDSRPGNGRPVTAADVRPRSTRPARRASQPDQRPSIGCGIKWR